MAVSNGFDMDRVMDALLQRVGWQQPTQANYTDKVSADNKASKSGRYFQGFHALCTIQNLFLVQDDPGITTDNFNAYLVGLKKDVIAASLTAVFQAPIAVDDARTISDKLSNTEAVLIPNAGNFVGYRIDVAKGNYTAQVNSATLVLNTSADVTLYLYNEFKVEPLKFVTISAAAGEQVIIQLDDWVLNHTSPITKGGSFFIGYYQNELAGQHAQAIDYSQDCRIPYKALSVEPFEAKEVNNIAAFARDAVSCTGNTYGLNLEISSYRDYTNTIVQSAQLFDELIGLHMAAKVLELLSYSTRANENQRITAENSLKVYADLSAAIPTENMPYVPGIKSRITKTVAQIRRHFFPPTPNTINVNL